MKRVKGKFNTLAFLFSFYKEDTIISKIGKETISIYEDGSVKTYAFNNLKSEKQKVPRGYASIYNRNKVRNMGKDIDSIN